MSGAQRLARQPLSVSVENLLEPGLDFALRFTW